MSSYHGATSRSNRRLMSTPARYQLNKRISFTPISPHTSPTLYSFPSSYPYIRINSYRPCIQPIPISTSTVINPIFAPIITPIYPHQQSSIIPIFTPIPIPHLQSPILYSPLSLFHIYSHPSFIHPYPYSTSTVTHPIFTPIPIFIPVPIPYLQSTTLYSPLSLFYIYIHPPYMFKSTVTHRMSIPNPTSSPSLHPHHHIAITSPTVFTSIIPPVQLLHCLHVLIASLNETFPSFHCIHFTTHPYIHYRTPSAYSWHYPPPTPHPHPPPSLTLTDARKFHANIADVINGGIEGHDPAWMQFLPSDSTGCVTLYCIVGFIRFAVPSGTWRSIIGIVFSPIHCYS